MNWCNPLAARAERALPRERCQQVASTSPNPLSTQDLTGYTTGRCAANVGGFSGQQTLLLRSLPLTARAESRLLALQGHAGLGMSKQVKLRGARVGRRGSDDYQRG